MVDESGWDLDVESASDQQLYEALRLLKGGKHEKKELIIKKELIKRVKNHNWTNERIINYLIWGVPKGNRRNEIAEDWAEAIGVSIQEFKNIMG